MYCVDVIPLLCSAKQNILITNLNQEQLNLFYLCLSMLLSKCSNMLYNFYVPPSVSLLNIREYQTTKIDLLLQTTYSLQLVESAYFFINFFQESNDSWLLFHFQVKMTYFIQLYIVASGKKSSINLAFDFYKVEPKEQGVYREIIVPSRNVKYS